MSFMRRTWSVDERALSVDAVNCSLSVSTHIYHGYLPTCICLFVYVSYVIYLLCICLSIRLNVYLCISLYVHVHIFLMSVYVYTSIYVYVCLYFYSCLCVNICLYVYRARPTLLCHTCAGHGPWMRERCLLTRSTAARKGRVPLQLVRDAFNVSA